MLAVLAVPYLSPKLEGYRVVHAPWETAASPDPAVLAPPSPSESVSESVLAHGETELRASRNEATVTNALPDQALVASEGAAAAAASTLIEDATGHALDAFYARLARTKAKEAGAVTRILHYGDSVVTSDLVSGTVRRRMQAQFGDAGHGFLLVANPWEWYFHNDVIHGASDGWKSSRIVGPLTNDGMYGLGGVTFTGKPGVNAWFGTSSVRSSFGKKVSRFDVYYLETESGGDVEAKASGTSESFSTKGAEKKSRVKSITVPDGESRLTLQVKSGSPRLFGVALERDVPGVVYDALGMNGGRAELLSAINDAHWAEQMALAKPALVILHFGTNESEWPGLNAAYYEKNLRAVVDKFKAAAPGASILIVAPIDRAENTDKGLRTRPIIKKLVASQRTVAQAAGVAFWNTFEAMGGEGTMATWVKKGLAGSDLTHPSPQGAEIVGDLLYRALAAGFQGWQTRQHTL